MNYRLADTYYKDYKELTPEERLIVKESLSDLQKALEERDAGLMKRYNLHPLTDTGSPKIWGGHLINRNSDFIFTYHHEIINGEKQICFRRIGDHSKYSNP